ncbi:hypothetical protein [Burkholderia ubonensis]|uniref:hypothetical protein n=1 Tax=Burkholderia ubonensis TaxID=101571 RepID=UPI000BA6D502|nr:hypothetical protein [Burkholderia ubonensis]PAK12430.1 hypothetical protein CJO66_22905 [Burkholderia ubonensis]RQP28894.1 hypothetical protein DF155_25980 [Burkholderia ubonensis]RQP31820.1 hypothetical protein DF154_28240 [Burkholderia ubonensis]RQP34328.1 hypothetical protein DF156_26780 [Burkholderia ubonensis]RQP49372.1 hypothetical protein DF144_24935 [Burkholderia ubonensis]
MASTQPVPAFHLAARDTPRAEHHNVLPIRSPRLLLPVTLTACSDSAARARLAALLRSPLGVHVASAHAARDTIRVQFDIAPEDLDFTLHALIAMEADAVIGPVAPRLRGTAANS